jgi:tRNA-Thr(GGU) m(6)t(6)A37 methyltransferase TsaA
VDSFATHPIGIIDSCYQDKFGTPRQPGLVPESLAKIKIFPEFQPADSLQGLEKFTHVWLVFWFHQNKTARFHAKVHPPRLQGQSIGVFATRSPHRPNPIGLSLVQLERVESDGIVVRGIDIISGTPILDIKPYLPEVESQPQASSGWTETQALESAETTVNTEIAVEWDNENLNRLELWQQKFQRTQLKELIEKTLKLDPRPLLYKGFEETESPYRSTHAVRFYEGDVHFKFVSSKRIQILDVKFN